MCSNYQMCKAENLWYPADLEWILENGKSKKKNLLPKLKSYERQLYLWDEMSGLSPKCGPS